MLVGKSSPRVSDLCDVFCVCRHIVGTMRRQRVIKMRSRIVLMGWLFRYSHGMLLRSATVRPR